MTQSLLIMAAGASSRMKLSVAENIGSVATEQANNRTKGLIEIGENGKPLLYYLLRNAQDAGYRTIYLITAADASFFRSTICSLPNLNQLRFVFVTQYIPKGRIKPWKRLKIKYLGQKPIWNLPIVLESCRINGKALLPLSTSKKKIVRKSVRILKSHPLIYG